MLISHKIRHFSHSCLIQGTLLLSLDIRCFSYSSWGTLLLSLEICYSSYSSLPWGTLLLSLEIPLVNLLFRDVKSSQFPFLCSFQYHHPMPLPIRLNAPFITLWTLIFQLLKYTSVLKFVFCYTLDLVLCPQRVPSKGKRHIKTLSAIVWSQR